MGAWGTELYQDDVACEVKEAYIELLRDQHDSKTATKKLKDKYDYLLSDFEDGPVFWLTLADIQWKYGRLVPEVKKHALKIIEQGLDLKKWQYDKRSYKKRKEVLEKLQEKLNQPQPPEKKIVVPIKYVNPWQLGDVYAYKLESDWFKDTDIYNQYLIFIKIGEYVVSKYETNAIVRVKITNNFKIPETFDEINELEFLQTNTGNETWAPNNVQYDKYGFLPIYVLKLHKTTSKFIHSKLIYIGNFGLDYKLPDYDYLPSNFIEMPYLWWKWFDELILERYKLYTLKQSEIYAPDYREKQKTRKEEMRKRDEEMYKAFLESKKNG